MGSEGPPSGGWEYSTSGRQTDIIIPPDTGGTYPFHSPLFVWPCQLWLSIVIGCILLGFIICQHQWALKPFPLPHMCSFWGPQPHHLTQGLHPSSVDAPVDVHGRSCNFPLIHPRKAFLVGHWVTTLPLFSCDINFLSPLVEVVLHGVGLVHLSHAWWMPIHKGMLTSDAMSRSWFQCRTHDLPFWFVTT